MSNEMDKQLSRGIIFVDLLVNNNHIPILATKKETLISNAMNRTGFQGLYDIERDNLFTEYLDNEDVIYGVYDLSRKLFMTFRQSEIYSSTIADEFALDGHNFINDLYSSCCYFEVEYAESTYVFYGTWNKGLIDSVSYSPEGNYEELLRRLDNIDIGEYMSIYNVESDTVISFPSELILRFGFYSFRTSDLVNIQNNAKQNPKNENFIKLFTDESIESLRRNVVYASFFTADGRVRYIYATRNHDLISYHIGENEELAKDDAELEQASYTRYVNVFDLQKKEFRKINLDTLYSWEELSLDIEIPPLESNPSAVPRKRNRKTAEKQITNIDVKELTDKFGTNIDDLF